MTLLLRILLLVLCTAATAASGLADQAFPDIFSLKAQAGEKRLAEDPQWAALYHYHSAWLHRGGKSIVDDADFFFHPEGKTDLAAELDAAIEALFDIDSSSSLHPQCRFPARYKWLKDTLGVRGSRFDRECTEFSAWADSLNADGMSLIFPASYLNNPASAFGHTLLRFDTGASLDQQPLLSYAASFAAETGPDNAVLYALKGLFGGYIGRFSVLPYYKKVKQYGDIENRDIWEYKLSLSKAEVDFAVRHLWELKDAVFDYYYFDDNCAFVVVSYLDAVRPSLNLSKHLRPWVIPIDTVRALAENADIIAETQFRPSSATTLAAQLGSASLPVKKYALAASESDRGLEALEYGSLSNGEKAEAYELAYERMRYYDLSQEQPEPEAKRRALTLLNYRSRLGSSHATAAVAAPSKRPEQGHATGRARAGWGQRGGDSFYEIGVRPAYHDLLDPSAGFRKGSEIRFLELTGRHYEKKSFGVESFIPLQIASLSPRNMFLRPVSWRFSSGAQRKDFHSSKRPLVAALSAAAGPAWKLTDAVVFYTLGGLQSEWEDEYDQDYAFGLSGASGVLAYPNEDLSLSFYADGARFGSGDPHSSYSLGAETQVTLSQNASIRIKAKRIGGYHSHSTELTILFDYFL